MVLIPFPFWFFFGNSPVDFALKVVQWSESETVRLQLWDIAGILEILLKFSFSGLFLAYFSPSSSFSFSSKNKSQLLVDSRGRTALLCLPQ